MKSKLNTYPFIPKSTSTLTPGQFWSIPLSNGLFACGRVIQLAPVDMLGSKVSFLGGVLDWVSASIPTPELIALAPCIAQGRLHIKGITQTGGEILGHRSLALDSITPWLFRAAQSWQNSTVQEGLIPIRPQTPLDNELPVFSTWGYMFAREIAEARFVKKKGSTAT